MTNYPAQRFRLEKRGLLRIGYQADITILDTKNLEDKATFQQPIQPPTGILNVIVNGKIEVYNGSFNNNYAGKVLKINKI